MSFSKIKEIENLNYKEIDEKIIEVKKEIFNLKLKKATRQSVKTHLFKQKKHQLAQLFTKKQQLSK
uniref:Ribosomal protein L29 n=1 Tax=Leiomenia cribrosa TaxID=217483 RepID=A0A4D6WYI5_9FLOR|nr:ribosomal protein L29 [Leiomenia cribrosa]